MMRLSSCLVFDKVEALDESYNFASLRKKIFHPVRELLPSKQEHRVFLCVPSNGRSGHDFIAMMYSAKM